MVLNTEKLQEKYKKQNTTRKQVKNCIMITIDLIKKILKKKYESKTNKEN